MEPAAGPPPNESARRPINEYDLGLPVPLAPLDERRAAVPAEVWRCLANARDNIDAILGARLREVRLFGSYARGQHDDESDVDVLILVDRVDGHERDCVVDAVLRASVASVRLSPLVLTVSQLDELRARELILAEDLDREGIAL